MATVRNVIVISADSSGSCRKPVLFSAAVLSSTNSCRDDVQNDGLNVWPVVGLKDAVLQHISVVGSSSCPRKSRPRCRRRELRLRASIRKGLVGSVNAPRRCQSWYRRSGFQAAENIESSVEVVQTPYMLPCAGCLRYGWMIPGNSTAESDMTVQKPFDASC